MVLLKRKMVAQQTEKHTIIIAKHRNGAVCDVNLKFVNELAKFMDNDENSFEHGDFPQSMQVNVKGDEFDSGAPIVKSSKMSDINDDFDDFNPNLDDAPF